MFSTILLLVVPPYQVDQSVLNPHYVVHFPLFPVFTMSSVLTIVFSLHDVFSLVSSLRLHAVLSSWSPSAQDCLAVLSKCLQHPRCSKLDADDDDSSPLFSAYMLSSTGWSLPPSVPKLLPPLYVCLELCNAEL